MTSNDLCLFVFTGHWTFFDEHGPKYALERVKRVSMKSNITRGEHFAKMGCFYFQSNN